MEGQTMAKNKMKTAAAMGMLKLYKVGTHKVYVRESDYFIRADDLKQAQQKWDGYKEARFKDPNTQLPEGIIYKHQQFRDTEYDYDWDNTMETVDEVDFNKDEPVHHEVVDQLYTDTNTEDTQ